MLYRGLHGRVGEMEKRQTAVETSVNELRGEVSGLGNAIANQGGKIDKLVDGLSSTGQQADRSAKEVGEQLRTEGDRKARERFNLIGAGCGLVTVTAIIVAAMCGPYLNKINATADASADSVVKLGAIREVLAQQGADVGRNHDAIEIIREKNRAQDSELREHDQDLAFMKGVLATKGWPTQ